ncbi:Vacuolar-processing enzyme, partial [Tetrabaena socialis]
MSPGPSPAFSTCLGDLYSVAWMENADACDLTHETLMAQYDIVRNRTSNNYTYNMGSHVMQYGTLAITREVAGDYQGMHNRGAPDGDVSGDSAACQPRPTWPAPITPLPPAAATQPSSGVAAGGSGDAGGGGDAAASPLAAVWAALHGATRWTAAVAHGGGPRLPSGGDASGRGGGSRRSAAEGGWRQQQQQPQPQLEEHPHRPHLQSRSLEQRDADLAPLRHRAAHGATPGARAAAQAALDVELARRGGVDAAAVGAATRLLAARPALAVALAATLNPQPLPADASAAAATTAEEGQLPSSATARRLAAAADETPHDGSPRGAAPAADAAGEGAGTGAAGATPRPLPQPSQLLSLIAHQLVYSPLGRPGPGRPPPAAAPLRPDSSSSNQGALSGGVGAPLLLPAVAPGAALPLVDDWDCLRAMVAAWEAACGVPMDQYAMRHTRLLANLCNAGVRPEELGEA